MKRTYLIIFLFFGLACAKSQILLKDLVVKGNKFYKDSSEAYSGYAFTKFDDGKISNEILLKVGIPSGKWIAYGYAGEILQSGNYKPVILGSIDMVGLKKVQRINICETKEGTGSFVDIFIVSDVLKVDVDMTHNKKTVDLLIGILKKQNILLDPNKINKIIAGSMELKHD